MITWIKTYVFSAACFVLEGGATVKCFGCAICSVHEIASNWEMVCEHDIGCARSCPRWLELHQWIMHRVNRTPKKISTVHAPESSCFLYFLYFGGLTVQ